MIPWKKFHTRLVLLLSATSLSGCVSLFLDSARDSGPLEGKELSNYEMMRDLYKCENDASKSCIDKTIQFAFNQADAYAKAARHTQTAQDLLSFGVLRAAGLVASGAAEGVSDGVLADRAIDAVGIQQVSRRFTPRTAVQALYTGATRMNCIALKRSEIGLRRWGQRLPISNLGHGVGNIPILGQHRKNFVWL